MKILKVLLEKCPEIDALAEKLIQSGLKVKKKKYIYIYILFRLFFKGQHSRHYITIKNKSS